ncbi:MAG: hypothetical protein JNL71_15555 [Rhodospirillales bacterium]|nr:hypothetical protein [Rhodospirillales bacterium]
MSSLSRPVIDTLLDLIDNKLTAMDVIDREDARIHSVLENAKRELLAVRGPALPRRTLRPRNSIRPGSAIIPQTASVAA